MKKFMIFMLAFLGLLVFDNQLADAYNKVCLSGDLYSSSVSYKECGNSNIYVAKNYKEHSSYLVAETNIDYRKGKIVYAGEIDGLNTFYSSGFNYFGVVYDEQNVFKTKMNIWSDISINGVVVYSGKIDDTILLDQSYRKFIAFYNEVGTYLIRQFVGDDLLSAIRVIIVDKSDINLSVSSLMYGDHNVANKDLPFNNSNLVFQLNGGKYGFGRVANVTINECKLKFSISSNKLKIGNDLYGYCLKINEENVVSLELFDGLGRSKTFRYIFNLLSEKVSIKLEDSVNASVTASRRVLIKANAGIGNKLDESHNLYYWSKNPNDKLTYEDFMTNYSLSDDKGMYSSNKGVILRDSEGVYYLYALAKDDISSVVVRSDEYILKNKARLNKFSFEDVLFIIGLSICAIVPVFIYIIVRGKDTA